MLILLRHRTIVPLRNLDAWLKKNKIVGVAGIDTRKLTNYIRDYGAPKGTLEFSNNNKK